MGPGRKICIFPYETKMAKGVVKGLKYIHFSPLFEIMFYFFGFQVDVSTTSLDPTFSFVLDAGLKIYIWSGERVRTTWQLRACSLACHLFSAKNCTFVLFIFVFFYVAKYHSGKVKLERAGQRSSALGELQGSLCTPFASVALHCSFAY